MANVFIDESVMSSIGDAIRSKTGKTDKILPANMPEEIESIEGGGTDNNDELLASIIQRTITEVSDENVTHVGSYAFANCSSLTSANFPQCTDIYDYAFGNCSALTTANFPECTGIESNAFLQCYNLTSVSFPVCKTIGSWAFGYCSSLTSANFPQCTEINKNAFYSCKSLSRIDLGTSSVCVLISSTTFRNTPIASGTGSIYVPASLVDAYKAATNWVYFSSIIYGIE